MSKIIITLFLIVLSLLTLPQLIQQNVIGDETVYIVEGDRYIHQPYSFYYNSGSPHVLKSLSAVFFAAVPLKRTYDPYFENTLTNVYTTQNFIYVQNQQFAQLIIILARIPHFILAIALGLAIFLFTKHHYGLKTATIALSFYTFNSLILAHAATSNLDIGTTAFTFFTLIAFYNFLNQPSQQKKWLIVTAIMLGLAQATKISAILLYPFILAMPIVFKQFKLIKQTLAIICLSFVVLWALYGFQIGPILAKGIDPAGIESVYGSIPVVKNYKSQITSFISQPIFPAGAYFANFAYQLSHSFYGHTVYINGRFTDQGIWYFIPLVFLYKNSLLLIAAIGLALFASIKHKIYNQPLYLYLGSWFVLMLVWSLTSKLQLGLRYFMPALPALWILTAKGITTFLHSYVPHKLHIKVLGGALTLYALSTLSVYPSFFTYTNEILRTQNPANYIMDSDYDWGQSVYKLGSEQKKQKLIPLYYKQYGGANLEYYKIEKYAEPETALRQHLPGYYAFSYSALVGLKKENPQVYDFFNARIPHAIIDGTIYVYKVDNF